LGVVVVVGGVAGRESDRVDELKASFDEVAQPASAAMTNKPLTTPITRRRLIGTP
jgi:hypothetical protein